MADYKIPMLIPMADRDAELAKQIGCARVASEVFDHGLGVSARWMKPNGDSIAHAVLVSGNKGDEESVAVIALRNWYERWSVLQDEATSVP